MAYSQDDIRNRLLGIIGELVNSHLTDPVIFDNQLFGPLIFLQNIKSNMAKACLDQQTVIEDRITSLTLRQLTSKASIDGMREMSRTTVMLWELACLDRIPRCLSPPETASPLAA